MIDIVNKNSISMFTHLSHEISSSLYPYLFYYNALVPHTALYMFNLYHLLKNEIEVGTSGVILGG